jgi:hypothetical protein
LTPFLGPLLSPREDRKHPRTKEIKLIEALLETIGSYAHLEARCHPAFDYWTPLRWHEFEQTTHYTWQFEAGVSIDTTAAGFRDNIRGDIRKATKQGVQVGDATLGEFLHVHADTVERASVGPTADASREALKRIDQAATARGVRSILAARDEDGRIHAAGYFVRDSRAVYYLAGGSDHELRSSGATSLLLSTAINDACQRGLGFDFEGSMLRPVERFFRAFGGTPAAYSIVRRTPSGGLRAERALKRRVRTVVKR